MKKEDFKKFVDKFPTRRDFAERTGYTVDAIFKMMRGDMPISKKMMRLIDLLDDENYCAKEGIKNDTKKNRSKIS